MNSSCMKARGLTHDYPVGRSPGQVGRDTPVVERRANRLRQNRLPRKPPSSMFSRLITASTRTTKARQRTAIDVCDACRCFSIALVIAFTAGSKSAATSALCHAAIGIERA